MHIDLVGRVRNTKLAARHGLMPLFEAVVNSVHAIQDSGRADGLIEIVVDRDPALFSTDVHGNTLANISAFTVADNGIGFTDENYASFETMDSRTKAERGGKGVGRLLWLKAFERVSVSSIYNENGEWRHRTFDFVLSPNGLERVILRPADKELDTPRTDVHLIDFRRQYRDASPKSVEAIARRVVEHCLEYYLLQTMPRVVVRDPTYNQSMDLETLYRDEYKLETHSRSFEVGNLEFSLTDVLLKGSGDTQHSLHFCAHNRVVQSLPLAPAVPYLASALKGESGEPVIYFGYVAGNFLDERVDAERTGFNIDARAELPFGGGLALEDLQHAAIDAASEFLGSYTVELRRQALERIKQFIDREPRYRPLLTHRPHQLESLPIDLSEDRLDVALHQLLSNWRQEVREEANRQLRQVSDQVDSFAQHREEFIRVIGDLQEVARSDLAEYVLHRATVLSFFEKLLGAQESGRFPREDALHSLFFPLKVTSNEIDFDQHNLWMLDERLSYHKYLASDIRFASQSQAPVELDGDDRPDLLVFNTPLAFVPGEVPFSSVVIVEFKRPERRDVRDDSSPMRQVLRYVEQIRHGRARRESGETIAPPADVPFYCYVVASLTAELRQEANEMGFTEAPDRQGFFTYNQNYRAYIEVLSYRKIYEDARKRNAAFFDRLQIRVR